MKVAVCHNQGSTLRVHHSTTLRCQIVVKWVFVIVEVQLETAPPREPTKFEMNLLSTKLIEGAGKYMTPLSEPVALLLLISQWLRNGGGGRGAQPPLI